MLCVMILCIPSVILFSWVRRLTRKSLLKKESIITGRMHDLDKLRFETAQLKVGNEQLEEEVNRRVALYDITKNICTTLEGNDMWERFREHIGRFISVDDCRFVERAEAQLHAPDCTIQPLVLHKRNAGYLVARGLREKDKDNFHVLAGQFLLGLRRTLLYQQVQELVIIDSLTLALSRRYFLERFNEEMERSRRFNLNLSFLMIDIDHFKEINDRYGHLVGDAVLREACAIIKSNIRQVDFMGRYGGEELSVVLAETDKNQARYAAERIRAAVEKNPLTVYDESVKVTISLGLATFPVDANRAQSLIEKSDTALYSAKKQGRNRVCASPENKRYNGV